MSAQDPVEIDQTTDFMWKATAAVATLASGFVAEKVVALGWRAISGRPAPREEDQLLNYKLAEIVTFAIISGATVTLVRELGLRQAAKWYSARRPNSPYALRAIGSSTVLVVMGAVLMSTGRDRQCGQHGPGHALDRECHLGFS